MKKLFQEPKTFKPKKSYIRGIKSDKLKVHTMATLGLGDVKDAIKLPEGTEMNEWLAMNVVDFYNQINVLYGSMQEHCTTETCPVMSAGSKYEYLWADGVDVKKPVKLPAPEYISNLMNWVQKLLDDESLFPTDENVAFPDNFQDVIKNIFKRLFRVYAHIYHSHLELIKKLGEEKHLNSCFKHFIFFVQEFELISEKEMAPLATPIGELSGHS
eukprot:Colp12_sorted_trinity150504_noHs@9189